MYFILIATNMVTKSSLTCFLLSRSAHSFQNNLHVKYLSIYLSVIVFCSKTTFVKNGDYLHLNSESMLCLNNYCC